MYSAPLTYPMSGLDIFKASKNGNLTEVRSLLDAGADVNSIEEGKVRDKLYYYIIDFCDIHCSD